MAGGFRGFLALWAGGGRAPPIGGPSGYRSMLAFWAGGACAFTFVPPVHNPGWRGFFAFWLGGANAIPYLPPQRRAVWMALAGGIQPPNTPKNGLIEIKSKAQFEMLERVAADPKEAARRGIAMDLARRSLAAHDSKRSLPERTTKPKLH